MSMPKEIRVYEDPDRTVRFRRFANLEGALGDAFEVIGVFYPERPSHCRLYVGEGWSLHMRGDWGRVVVTGDLSLLSEVKLAMRG